MANPQTNAKTDNFRGKGDHDQNGLVGGAAKPEAQRINTEADQPKDRAPVEPTEAQPHVDVGDGTDADKAQVPANVAEAAARDNTPEPESWGDRQARIARENERKLGQGERPTTPGETGATSPSDRVNVGDLQQPNPQTVGR